MKSQVLTLADVGEWGSGGTPLASRGEYYGGEIPWLIIEDLNDGIVESSRKTITALGLENSAAKIVPQGTILMAMYGSIGKLGVAGMPCATNQAIAYCKCDTSQIDRQYLFFWLFHERNRFVYAGRGGTQQNISQEFLKDYPIRLPSLADQRRIAARLEQADRLRRTRRYALELADAFLPAAFLEMFGDPANNPKGWPLLPFGDVCTISDRMVDPREDVFADLPQVSSEDIESISGYLGPLLSARQKGVISVNFLVDPNDILFSKIRPKLRKVAYPGQKVLCSADIYPIAVDASKCTLPYMLFYLRSGWFSGIVEKLAEARSNIPKINRDELSKQYIPVPPLSLQRRFADLVREHERLRAMQREALRQAEHLFQALLHDAFADGAA